MSPPTIGITFGWSPHYGGAEKTAAEWMKFQNHDLRWENGEFFKAGESSCYMQSKFAEANCEWFLPFWRRMAHGEEVDIGEIKEAYRKNNEGDEMPYGFSGTLMDLLVNK